RRGASVPSCGQPSRSGVGFPRVGCPGLKPPSLSEAHHSPYGGYPVRPKRDGDPDLYETKPTFVGWGLVGEARKLIREVRDLGEARSQVGTGIDQEGIGAARGGMVVGYRS